MAYVQLQSTGTMQWSIIVVISHAIIVLDSIRYAMLCYATVCYAMLCYSTLCYAMLCAGTIPSSATTILSALVQQPVVLSISISISISVSIWVL